MSQRPGIDELEAMRRMREEYLARNVGPSPVVRTAPDENPAARTIPDEDAAAKPSLDDSLPEVMLRKPTNEGLPAGYLPSESELLGYLNKWDTLNTYVAHEEALQMLFRELPDFSRNVDLKHIIVKCSVLNDFYATNIYQIEPLAEHILAIADIDARLAAGDETLVEEIAEGENVNRNYSFATKYCAHHQPEAFPIYDRYVDDVLWFLHSEMPDLMPFRYRKQLQHYPTFKKAVAAVRDEFGLGKFSFKDIDRYLWQLGKDFYNPYVNQKNK